MSAIYLSAAAQAIATNDEAAKAWVETQKDRLKRGQPHSVLDTLRPYQEAPGVDDDQAPVRVCHRYLSGRLDRLHYDVNHTPITMPNHRRRRPAL